MYYNYKGMKTDLFNLDNFSNENEEELKNYLEESLHEFQPKEFTIKGLKKMIKENPKILYQTNIIAKEYLGFK